jgi:hypothetical protein
MISKSTILPGAFACPFCALVLYVALSDNLALFSWAGGLIGERESISAP